MERILDEMASEFSKRELGVMDDFPIGISVSDLSGSLIYINRHGLEMFGYASKDEFFKKNALTHYCDPNDRQRFQDCIAKGMGTNFEARFYREDRSVFWASVSSLSRQVSGRKVYINFFQDISGQKAALEQSTHLSRVLKAIRKVDDLINRVTEKNKLLEGICKSLIKTRGYHSVWILLLDDDRNLKAHFQAGLGDPFRGWVDTMAAGRLPQCSQKALSTRGVVTHQPLADCRDCPLVQTYGEHGAMTIRLENDNRIYGVMCASIPFPLIQDQEEQSLFQYMADAIAHALKGISEKKSRMRAEKRLKDREGLLSDVFNSIQDGVSILDKDLTIARVNSTTKKWYSDRGTLEGKKCFFCYQNREKPCNPCPSIRCMASGTVEREVVKGPADSDLEWIELFAYPLRDAQSKEVIGAVEFARDITRPQKMQAYNERLLSAIDQAKEMIAITDADGTIEYANPSFAVITGYDVREIKGRNPRFLKSGEHDTAFYTDLWQTVLSGRQWTGRVVNQKKDGSLYTAECSITPVKDDRNHIQGFVWISKDISEKLRFEERMIQNQKIEAIGNLAGGIAHDFNNILSPIIGFTELSLGTVEKGSALEDNLEEIHGASLRAKDLVKQILLFARRSEEKIQPVQVSLVVKEALKFLGATLPSTIEIRQDIETDSLVMASPTQLYQVIMNLCTNASYAMEENGGILDVSLKQVDFKEGPDCKRLGLGAGNYNRLTVSDTGTGIDPGVIDRIFDPYITTKSPEEGTGLGLAVVAGIVEACKGRIFVESALGKGSRFEVYLPVTEQRQTDPDGRQEDLPRGTETILFVDDEKPIAKIGKRFLSEFGYKVKIMTSGVEALEYFKTRPDHFDLIVTDMTMPEMTGDRLAEKCLSIRPEIPIILCSGYTKKMPVDIKRIGVKAFLQKPLVMGEFIKTVRMVLDGLTQ